MKSTSEDFILDQIKDKLIIYLLSGRINPQTILDPSFNIDGVDRLLKVHFVISKAVLDFIDDLKNQIKYVKVTTNQKSTEARGNFRGKINVPKTIRHRLSTNYNDKTLFVIDEVFRNSETDENIVLKETLRCIREIIDTDLEEFLKSDYEWVGHWKNENYEKLCAVYEKNIYLRNIKNSKKLCTKKMIQRVKKSRTKLYRNAAEILSIYHLLTSSPLDEDLAKELLGDTFIKPNKDTLFELFWCFRIIDLFQQNYDIKFLTRSSNKQLLAHWKTDKYNFELYHQGVGDFNLTQNLELDDLPNDDGYLKRYGISRIKSREFLDEFFNIKQKKNFSAGIPDIFLIIKDIESDLVKKVIICEVKNSTRKQTAEKGLVELINYMTLIKKGDQYFNNIAHATNSKNISGFLFIDNQNIKNKSSKSINVIRTGDKLNVDMFIN